MTLFLLEFDRDLGRLVGDPKQFADNDRELAAAARLDTQRRVLKESLNRDVVLLEAESLEVLRETHGSFFMTPDELVERIAR
jgi:hypothetical protein